MGGRLLVRDIGAGGMLVRSVPGEADPRQAMPGTMDFSYTGETMMVDGTEWRVAVMGRWRSAEGRPREQSIRTFTGGTFWPLDPYAEDVHPEDVAHGLSHCCRFAGQCREFYSVAQHSVLVSELLAPRHGPWVALLGLCHDGSEAYVPDMPRPVKHAPGLAALRAADARLQATVYAALCGRAPTASEAALVKWADDVALEAEQRDLFDWPFRRAVSTDARALDRVVPASPPRAKARWLRRYALLRERAGLAGLTASTAARRSPI